LSEEEIREKQEKRKKGGKKINRAETAKKVMKSWKDM
jgi:hypothetical protein